MRPATIKCTQVLTQSAKYCGQFTPVLDFLSTFL